MGAVDAQAHAGMISISGVSEEGCWIVEVGLFRLGVFPRTDDAAWVDAGSGVLLE